MHGFYLEEWWEVSHSAPHFKGVFLIALGLGVSFLVWGVGSGGLPEYWERLREQLIVSKDRCSVVVTGEVLELSAGLDAEPETVVQLR